MLFDYTAVVKITVLNSVTGVIPRAYPI